MISKKLAEIRKKHNLNKREMSERLGIPYTTYNNYETGQREPGSNFLIKFSQEFDVSIDYIMENQPKQIIGVIKKNDTIADIILRLRSDDNFKEVVIDLSKLSAEQIVAVKTFLSAFKK